MGKHGLGVVGRECNATPRAKLEQKMGGCFGIRCAEVGGLPTQNLMAEQTFIIIFVQLFGPMYNVWLPGENGIQQDAALRLRLYPVAFEFESLLLFKVTALVSHPSV